MDRTTAAKPAADAASHKLGTFAGVFTPSIMTILGIILFLRLGYVVGSSGLLATLLIIVLANAISVLTSFSVAAIATNLKIKGGGDYYLISRTLGLGFGGAIGLVLFVAQAVSIGFYAIGFAEAAIAVLQPAIEHGLAIRAAAGAAVVVLFGVAWLGNDWATRVQYVVMALMAAALIAFALGAFEHWSDATLAANLERAEPTVPFWIAFAIFFPAVTGFTQGVSMSGDLRSPGKSLPTGTFAAVGLSFAVYVVMAVLLAASVAPHVLVNNYGAMKTVAVYAPLVDIGIITSALSCALASFIAAPRILQSLAKDRIFASLTPFARGHGPANNPRRGVLLAGVIALAVVALGNLNLVAAVVTMFFLLSYGLINYATFYEARAASPSFRPGFRWYDYRLSLAGGLGCLGAMVAIDPLASLAAAAVLFALFWYLKYRAVPTRWADSRRSYHLKRVRDHLIAAQREPEHPRDWRPILLVFSDDAHRRERLLRFTAWIEGGSGLSVLVRFLEGQGPAMLEQRSEAAAALTKDLKAYDSTTFPLIVASRDLDRAIPAVVQSAGLGPVHINTVLVNWFEGSPALVGSLMRGRYSQNLRTAFRLGCNLLVLDAEAEEWETLDGVPADKRVIDVWWSQSATGQLMLLLAHLTSRDDAWQGARIRILDTADPAEAEARIAAIRAMLEEVRIEAEAIIVPDDSIDALVAASRDSSIVFVPFLLRAGRLYHPLGGELDEILPKLPIVCMALAAENVDLDADPDEGTQSEIATATDRLSVAKRGLEDAEKEAAAALETADRLQEELLELARSGQDADAIEAKRTAAIEAQAAARTAARKAARSLAVREMAERRAKELGIETAEAEPAKDG